ncbi:hypothetical protein TRAPUB_3584, partial [Trametes pubescens]
NSLDSGRLHHSHMMISLPQPPQTPPPFIGVVDSDNDQRSPSPNALPLHDEDDHPLHDDEDDDSFHDEDDNSLPNNPFHGNTRSTNPLSDHLDDDEHHFYDLQFFFRTLAEFPALHHMTGNPAFGPDMTGHPAFGANTNAHAHRTVSPTPTQALSAMPTSPPRSQSSRSAASGGSDVSMASAYTSFTAAIRGQERHAAKERADRKRLVKEVEQLQAEIAEVKASNAVLQEQVTDMSNEVREVGGAVSHLSGEMGNGFTAVGSELSELNRGFKSMEGMFGQMLNEFREFRLER